MRAAGFVLVGGRSSRMGADKALLPYRGATMAGYVAEQVMRATGSVTLVGDPVKYGHLGCRVIPDRLPGSGPLGGITTALAASPEQWILIAACDMPNISATFLLQMIEIAETAFGTPDCVVPVTETGRQPLCALYHKRALPLLDSLLQRKLLKMQDAIRTMDSVLAPFPDADCFRNVNTPEDFQAHG
jgi:molybdenum cofactor guanylyltransferase